MAVNMFASDMDTDTPQLQWYEYESTAGSRADPHLHCMYGAVMAEKSLAVLANRSEIKLAFHQIEGSLLPFPHRTKSRIFP
jgi:hypothetical protein